MIQKSPMEILNEAYFFSDELYEKTITADNRMLNFYNKSEISDYDASIIELILGEYKNNNNPYFSLTEKTCNKLNIEINNIDNRDIILISIFFRFLEKYCNLSYVYEKEKNVYISYIESVFNKIIIVNKNNNCSEKEAFCFLSIIITSFLDYANNNFYSLMNNKISYIELFDGLDKVINEVLENEENIDLNSRRLLNLRNNYISILCNSSIIIKQNDKINNNMGNWSSEIKELNKYMVNFLILNEYTNNLQEEKVKFLLTRSQKLFNIWEIEDKSIKV